MIAGSHFYIQNHRSSKFFSFPKLTNIFFDKKKTPNFFIELNLKNESVSIHICNFLIFCDTMKKLLHDRGATAVKG